MSKKITEMPELFSLENNDLITGIDASQVDLALKNIKISRANLFSGIATDADVNAVQSDLNGHKSNPVKTDHTDAVDSSDLSAHDGNATAHGGNIPTTAQKAALDANGSLSGANPVADANSIISEGDELKSTGQPVDRILQTDGANGFTYIPTPSGGSGSTDLGTIYTPGGNQVEITSSSGQNTAIVGATGSNAGVMTGSDKSSLDNASTHVADGGVHVPSGGTTNQVLAKIDNTDGNTEWQTVATGGQPPAPAQNSLGISSGWTPAGDSATRDVGTSALDVAQGDAPVAVQSNLDTHTGAANPHSGSQPDAPVGNQLGVNGGWTAAGDSATRNVGTGAGDVAAGNAVSTHAAGTDVHAISGVTGLQAALDDKPDSPDVDDILKVTQAQYDAGPKDARTLYLIVG